jgi:hypothetical protein
MDAIYFTQYIRPLGTQLTVIFTRVPRETTNNIGCGPFRKILDTPVLN